MNEVLLQYPKEDVEWQNQQMEHAQQLNAEAEKQEQDEPYGYFLYDIRLDAWVQSRDNNKGVAFYTTPQTKKWIGLTENQIDKLEKEFIGFPVPNIYNFVKSIEAKLKEKNT